MEIIVNFAYRSYVFYSLLDVEKARKIYAYSVLDLDGFENELKSAGILMSVYNQGKIK